MEPKVLYAAQVVDYRSATKGAPLPKFEARLIPPDQDSLRLRPIKVHTAVLNELRI